MSIVFQRYNGSEWVTETESASGGVTNHASLTNLDFALSGHTGVLQTEQAYEIIDVAGGNDDINQDGNWRQIINANGELNFEKRVAGSWVNASTFLT